MLKAIVDTECLKFVLEQCFEQLAKRILRWQDFE